MFWKKRRKCFAGFLRFSAARCCSSCCRLACPAWCRVGCEQGRLGGGGIVARCIPQWFLPSLFLLCVRKIPKIVYRSLFHFDWDCRCVDWDTKRNSKWQILWERYHQMDTRRNVLDILCCITFQSQRPSTKTSEIKFFSHFYFKLKNFVELRMKSWWSSREATHWMHFLPASIRSPLQTLF